MGLNPLVAFTGRCFKRAAPPHADTAVPARDDAGALQGIDSQGDRRAMDAQHDRQHVVLQVKFRRADAILGLQQPAGTTLSDVVQRVARRGLHGLQ